MVSLKELCEQVKAGGSNAQSSAADQLLWVVAWSPPEPSLEKWEELHDCSGSWFMRLYLCTPTFDIPYLLEIRNGYLQFKTVEKPTKKQKVSRTRNPAFIPLSSLPTLLVYSAYIWVLPSWFLLPFVLCLPNSMWMIAVCFVYQRMGIAGLLLIQVISVFISLAISTKRGGSISFLRHLAKEGSVLFLQSDIAAQLPPDIQHGLFVSHVSNELSKHPGGKSLVEYVTWHIKKYGVECVLSEATLEVITKLVLPMRCKKSVLALAAASNGPLFQLLQDVFQKIVVDDSAPFDESYNSQFALSQDVIHGLFVSHVATALSNNPGGHSVADLISHRIKKYGIECVTSVAVPSVLNALVLPPQCKKSVLTMVVESNTTCLLRLFLRLGVDPSLSGWTHVTMSRLWSREWHDSDGNTPPNQITIQELSLLQLCLESGFPPKRPVVGNLEDFRTFYAMYKLSQADVAGCELATDPCFPTVFSAMISSGWDANALGGRLLAATTVKSDWETFKLLIHNGMRAHEVTELNSNNMLLAWDGSVMQDRNFWRLVLECEDLYDEFMKSWSPRSISLWMGISSTSVVFDAIIHASRQQNRNPLELTFLLGNGRAVQQL